MEVQVLLYLWSSSTMVMQRGRPFGDRSRLREEGPLNPSPSAAAAHSSLFHEQFNMFPFPPFLANLRRPQPRICSFSANLPNPPSTRRPLPCLPPEIWVFIIREATLSLPLYRTSNAPSRLAWLASLSLLSADFRALAQPELFSTTVVHSLADLEHLIEALEGSSRLKKVVRALHVRWREREGAELAGSAAKGNEERSWDRWEDGLGRVDRLIGLRELVLRHAGKERACFDLSWVAGSRGEFKRRTPLSRRKPSLTTTYAPPETLVKLTLESLDLERTSHTLTPFHLLTSLTLRHCTFSPSVSAVLSTLLPSLRSLKIQSCGDSPHTIYALLSSLAPQLESLSWSPKPSIENGRNESSPLMATLPLCTSLLALRVPVSTFRHLTTVKLPLSLQRLHLDLSRSGEETKEVLEVMEVLPSSVEKVELSLSGWMSVQASEEMLQQVGRSVAGKVRLTLIEERTAQMFA